MNGRRFALLSTYLTLSASGAAPVGSPAIERIAGRGFPSIFQAWNPAEADGVGASELEARHDLLFHAADFFGLRWDAEHPGQATAFAADSIEAGLRRRAELLGRNPDMVLLCEIRYRDAHRSFLAADSPWWARDENGQPRIGWEEGGYLMLDFGRPDFRDHVAARAAAAVGSGVFDGVMLDWWEEDDDRVALIQKVRAAVGADALILVNANDRRSPRSAPFVNGHFMECYRSAGEADWARIEASLAWAEANLRPPRINCLETWWADSRRDLDRMRATTALGLTASDGYVLFADPNPLPTPDHLHDWYPFWDAELGAPVAAAEKRDDGSVRRAFENGLALYAPPGCSTVVEFEAPHRRVSTGETGLVHAVEGLDGEIFLHDG